MHNSTENNDFRTAEQPELPLIWKKPRIRSFRNSVPWNPDSRIMTKKGKLNLYLINIPGKFVKYLLDFWNTLVNMRWRWIILFVALANIIAYVSFGALFYLDALYSGDFENIENHKTCINGVHNFTSFVMLGIETLTTTGYGYVHPTENCKLVYLTLTLSTLVMFFIDGAFISVVYVKIGKPLMVGSIFSKKAIINLRNGKLCLVLRVNDRTGKHWIGSKVQLFLIKHNRNSKSINYIEELCINRYGTLFWPVDIIHEINFKSPLWTCSAKDVFESFEILAVISGSSIKTGQFGKTQTSYLSKEILWGYRFHNCMEYNTTKCEFSVCKKKFNEVYPYDAPLCSAETLTQLQKDINIVNEIIL